MRPLLKLYVAFVCLAAAAALVAYIAYGDLSRTARLSPNFIRDLVFFLIAGCLLDMMIVPMAQGGSVSAGFAAFLAALLVLGPSAAAICAAVAAACTDLCVRRRIPITRTLFNMAHTALAVLVAGVLYYEVLGGGLREARLDTALGILRPVAAAAAMFLVGVTAVSVAIALDRNIPAGRLWLSNVRQLLAMDACLAGLGLLVAILYVDYGRILEGTGWVLAALVLAVPSALLYYSSHLYTHMTEIYERTLETLGSLIEVRLQAVGADAHARGHGKKVADLAAQIAEELRLEPEEVQALRYAGRLHEIGMVSMRAEALREQASGPAAISHCETGYDMLKSIPFLLPAAAVVRYHDRDFDDEAWNEPLDPEELKLLEKALPRWRAAQPKPWTSWHKPPADALFLASQILHAAEHYCSCQASGEECLRDMEARSGAAFHPLVVQAMRRVLRSTPALKGAAEPAHAA